MHLAELSQMRLVMQAAQQVVPLLTSPEMMSSLTSHSQQVQPGHLALAHQHSTAGHTVSDQPCPHLSVHAMLADARGNPNVSACRSAPQQDSVASQNMLMQASSNISAPDDCDERGRSAAPGPKASQSPANAGNAPQLAQPVADQQASHMHAVVPSQQAALANRFSTLHQLASSGAGNDLMPPHTAAAISTAYAVLGQSRQIAEAAAAAVAATASRHGVSSLEQPVQRNMHTDMSVVTSAPVGKAALATAGAFSTARRAAVLHPQTALSVEPAAAPADCTADFVGAAEQHTLLLPVNSSPLDRQAIAELADATLVQTAGTSFEAPPTDVAHSNPLVPVLDAQPNGVSDDPIATHTGIVESSKPRVPLQLHQDGAGSKSWSPPQQLLQSQRQVRSCQLMLQHATC